MTKPRDREISVRTRWVVELFPHESKYPNTKDTDASSLKVPITLIASDQNVESFQKEIQKQEQEGQQEVILAGGLTSISVSRTKVSPEAQCTFSITGDVPFSAFPGTWCLITSVSIMPDGTERKLIRFVGQIYDMSPQYVVDPRTALIGTQTTFRVREWSSALQCPVRYDIFSIVNSLPQQSAVAALGTIQFAAGKAGEAISASELQKIVSNSFNPFELAHLILKLVGAINQDDSLQTIKSLGKLGLPEVALTMPSIPPNLLERLGMSDVNSKDPFSTGFVRVMTGVQQGSVHNDGSWNGVFKDINEYGNKLNRDPKDRPIALGLAALVSTGESAWALISKHCDPALNEFFTDVLYEEGDTPGSIIAKPTIFVRDKPFLMRKLKDAFQEAPLNTWSLYDDLPRVRVDDVYITSFGLSNTFLNSPNFLRVNYQSQAFEANALRTLSEIYGTTRLLPEMRRFGGQEFFVETQFLSKDVIAGRASNVNFEQWFQKIKGVVAAWHGHNYRMATGNLVLRDDNIPLMVGFNVQFTFGQFEIVGHVESMNINYIIDDSGRDETVTQVKLSRIVQSLNGKLDFIDPSAFANLLKATPVASPTVAIGSSGVLGKAAAAVSGLIEGVDGNIDLDIGFTS